MEKVALSTLSQVFFALHSILNNKASASVCLPHSRRRRVLNEWKTLEDICMPQYWRGDDKRVANKARGRRIASVEMKNIKTGLLFASYRPKAKLVQ